MTTSDKWEILEARIIRLEEQNQRLRTGCILASVVIACVLTLGAYKAGVTVEAQRFVLKSAKGEVRAELTTLDGDYPRLTFLSPNGEKVTELSPLGVSVFDRGILGKLPVGHFGNTGLYFRGQNGQVVLELGGASVSALQIAPIPQITMFNEKGDATWRAPSK